MKPEKLWTAARHWWTIRRPKGWTIEQHLESPSINCVNPQERELAYAVAARIRATRGYAQTQSGDSNA